MKKKLALVLAILCLAVLCLSPAAMAQGGDAPPALPAQGEAPPDGAPPDGTPPDGGTPPSGAVPNGSPSDGMPGGASGGGGPGGFGGSGTITQGTAANTLDASTTVDGATYSAAGDNENALRVQGDIQVTLTNITVEKTAGATANTEDSDFYGQNAGLLATDGAAVTITGATVTTNADGGNAVFSHGEGTTVAISNATIRTALSHSGGVHVAGGGTLTASNLDVETQGSSSAAVRSDRGGGTLVVTGGTYATWGTGSPAIYSTANIIASDATFTAGHAEALVIEGQNSIELTNCDVTGNMESTFLADIKEGVHNIMIYQSMSGDAEVGQSRFVMTGGSITAQAGEMFYVTNTSCVMALTDVDLTLATGQLLTIAGNNGARGWGSVGSNGGHCQLTADAQALAGNITVDAVSSLALTLQNGSSYAGAINQSGAAGDVTVSLDAGSVWTLTADSHISAFDGDASQVAAGEYHLYVAGEALV